jgi:hypothetical protein
VAVPIEGARWRWRATALVTVALAYAWIAGGLRPFTWPAAVSTTLGGVAIFALAWRYRGDTTPDPHDGRYLVAWTAWLVAVTGWELWALSMTPRSTHPTLSSMINSAMETHPGRSIAVLAWLALGWWLAGRQR